MKTAQEYIQEAKDNLNENKSYTKKEAIEHFKYNAPSVNDAADVSWLDGDWVNNVTGEVLKASEKTKPAGVKDHVSPLDR